MKSFLRMLCLALFSVGLIQVNAQTPCPAGFSKASINWDAMAFLVDGGNVSITMAQNQNFAFGKNKLTIKHSYSNGNNIGDNTTHSGETNSYGVGADIQFKGNGTISLIFQSAVQNVKFSIYDIDLSQTINITAEENGMARPITSLTKVSGNILTVNGSGTNSATATAAKTEVANTLSDGTVNVDIAGPVTKIIINVTNTATSNGKNGDDGSFWISDIAACSPTNPFPTAYRQIAKPFTNQPGYVLAARNNIVYMVDPATGRAVEVFRDPDNLNINSMGYDPHNKILYYTNSLTGANNTANANNKAIRKYDFNSETFSILVNDVTAALGIPTFGSGVESGGASFYDGALYLGIEGTNSTRSIVWRIDFDASLNPVSAVEAYGIDLTGHDWGDFVIANGVLYDFDGGANGAENVYHLDLQTGAYLQTYGKLPFAIRQVATDWNDQVFNIGGAPSATGEVAPYNYNGTVATAQQKVIKVGTTTPSGSWGDAAEAFKPKSDFGDAPASYDPNPLAPAMHDMEVNLKLGDLIDYEWDKIASSDARADGDDEDGVGFVPIFNGNSGNYQVDVKVFNNTGTTATLCGWIDLNGNNEFDEGEGVSSTVPSSSLPQVISLYWTGITSTLPANSHTYLRIRITSAANGMTTANPTGYFPDGEVEDYYVIVNTMVLDMKLLDFAVQKKEERVAEVSWTVSGETRGTVYELQRSNNGTSWTTLMQKGGSQRAVYTFLDDQPLPLQSYYRLKITAPDGSIQYSKTQQINFDLQEAISLYPNPAASIVFIKLNAGSNYAAKVSLIDLSGKTIVARTCKVQKGANTLEFALPESIGAGLYTIQVALANHIYTQRVLVKKN